MRVLEGGGGEAFFSLYYSHSFKYHFTGCSIYIKPARKGKQGSLPRRNKKDLAAQLSGKLLVSSPDPL